MNDESYFLCNEPGLVHNQLRQRLLSWSSHVRSWVDAGNLDVHVMKYEDMKRCSLETFTKGAIFAQLEKSPAQIKKALQFSQFNELQRQEQENGFVEKSPECKVFFHKGEIGYWREVLSDYQANTIIKAHKDVMERFGYLNAKGEPVF
jgi:hypothetical protein